MPPPLGGSSGGCPALWSISHHKGYCSCESTVRPPELRGLSAWQATPSRTVYRLACHRLLPWLRVTFAIVPDAAWPASDQRPWGTAPAAGLVGRLGCPSVSDQWGVVSFLSLRHPRCARVCDVLGNLAPVHRCARSVRCDWCAVSWATWLLFSGVPPRWVALRVECPGPLGSCSPVWPLGVLCCVCGVLGHLAPVHGCSRSVRLVACAVSWATWLLFTGVPAGRVMLRVPCPGLLGSCSPVGPLGVLCCVCGVLGHLAPVHLCACSVRCFACAVSWATWLLFTSVPARLVVLRVRCPGTLGSCSPVCPLCALLCVCDVWGHLAPVHRCARSVCCVACAVSWAPWLLFTGAPARCVVLRVQCPGPLGSCSPVCLLRVLCWVCRVLGPLTPVHRCPRSVCCVACAVSSVTWLLFTSVPAWCVAVRVRCPGLLGCCSPPCPLGVLCCVCGGLGHLVPVHRSPRSVCRVACTVFWAPWLLFTAVPARCAVLGARCPGPLGSCSPVRPLCLLCRVCGVLGPFAPVHRCPRSVCRVVCAVSWATWLLFGCACSVCCVACAVSWATWPLFTGAPAWRFALLVRCRGPLGSCSPVRPLGVSGCVYGVLGHLAPVHRCARSVCCDGCAVCWAPWLLFTGVPATCVVLRVPCPWPLGSCSPVCPLGVLCCVCAVLGDLAPVQRCARSVRCFTCAVSWATWLLFIGAPAWWVALLVRCPGPLGSCSPVCPLGLSCCVCGVLPPWLLFTGVLARCAVLGVRCPGPLGFWLLVCLLVVLCCMCGVLGNLASVHWCARPVFCVACTVSWPLGSCSPVCSLGVLCRGLRLRGSAAGRTLVHPNGGCL